MKDACWIILELSLQLSDLELPSFCSLLDSVKFGEVALQPPTLTAKPRKSVIKDKVRHFIEFYFSFLIVPVTLPASTFAGEAAMLRIGYWSAAMFTDRHLTVLC